MAPTPPAGYWVNPANTTQWLTQADAAKIGRYCMQGPTIGVYTIGGNFQNSVLACENMPCQQSLMIYGAIAAAIVLLAPGNLKLAAILPAGFAFVNCAFSGVSL
jgi:hypothetical protein